MGRDATETETPRPLLARILETPELARIVQSLEPRVLHRLVRHCGLEDSGAIVALATTEQLERVFDHDLWRNERTGEEERLDADRFALWLEVLAEAGHEVAARRLVEMDFEFVTAALSRHLFVLDAQSMALVHAFDEMDVEEGEGAAAADAAMAALETSASYELGGYTVVARTPASWDALLGVLVSLDAGHPAFFGRLMARCARYSSEYIVDNGGLYEVLTSEEQVLADAAADRERRREQEGFVAPPQAVAFLKLCRDPPPAGVASEGYDPLTAAYFRTVGRRDHGVDGPSGGARAERETPGPAADPDVARFLATLRETGVLLPSAPPLLAEASPSERSPDRLLEIRPRLLFVQEHAAPVYARRMEELGYLANVLMSGCRLDGRRFRPVEAADAVLATCNLGLQNGPGPSGRASAAAPPLPIDLLVEQDLVNVFRAGWRVLHGSVSLHVARTLAAVLRDLPCRDPGLRRDVRRLGTRLEAQVNAGTPWGERDRLDVLAPLDALAWSTLRGLLGEYPVVPRDAAERAAGHKPLRVASAFDYIADSGQIAWVRDFVASLPSRLRE
jgi:hypothetical protein